MGDIAARIPARGEEDGAHPPTGATSVAVPLGSGTLTRPKPQKTILVLASAEPAPGLVDELRRRCLHTGARVLVVAPVLASGLGRWTNDDRWRIRAEEIVERTIGMLAAAGIAARGRLGDVDARQALDDALCAEEVAEIIVVDSASASTSRLEQDLALRAAAGRELTKVTFVPPAQATSPPPRVARRRAWRIAAAATTLAVALAFLTAVGSGRAGLLAGLGFVLGVIALNVGSKIAVLAALWLAARRWLLRPPPA